MRGQSARLSGLALLAVLMAAGCKPDRAPAAEFGTTGGDGGVHAPGLPTAGTVVDGGVGGQALSGAGGGGSEVLAGASAGGESSGLGGQVQGGFGHHQGGVGGSRCGNGLLDPGEPCESDLFADQTCATFGYDLGVLSCADCAIVLAGCSGTESCFDGRDNDGDGDVDCTDSECSNQCASLCDYAPILADPSTVTGDTSGHTNVTSASCRGDEGAGGAGSGPTGREIAYRFVPRQTGVLEARLWSEAAELTLSLRTSCAEAGTELAGACGLGSVVAAEVVEDLPIYVLVDGVTDGDAGAFELSVATRAVECGDRAIDLGEECDDGALQTGDGCDADCRVEATEAEQHPTQGNDTIDHANPYLHPFYGLITAGDVDVISAGSLDVGDIIRVRTYGIGDDVCARSDTFVELLDESGGVLAFNDDGAGTLCSDVTWEVLQSGIGFVRVSASGDGDTPTFPYQLEIVVN